MEVNNKMNNTEFDIDYLKLFIFGDLVLISALVFGIIVLIYKILCKK